MQANNIWFLYTRDIHAKYLSVTVPGRLSRSLGTRHWEARALPCGDRAGPGSQGLSCCPRQEQAAGGHWGIPSPRHRESPWGLGHAEARPGHRLKRGLGQVGPMARQGSVVGSCRPAVLWSHWDRGWWYQGGLKRGPGLWAGWGETPWGLKGSLG